MKCRSIVQGAPGAAARGPSSASTARSLGAARGAPSRPSRRRALAGAAAPLIAAWLAGCASPAPAPRWYALRSEGPPGIDASGAADPRTGPAPVVQLLGVTVSELLERDTLLVAEGGSSVRPLTGHRWAEPLRDAVPRLLRADLARLLGDGRVWGVPLPAGVTAQRTLRVEIVSLLADPARRVVDLHALAVVTTPVLAAAGRGEARAAAAGSAATNDGVAASPLARTLRLSAPAAGPAPDALAQAHRVVLWRLAEAIAALVRG